MRRHAVRGHADEWRIFHFLAVEPVSRLQPSCLYSCRLRHPGWNPVRILITKLPLITRLSLLTFNFKLILIPFFLLLCHVDPQSLTTPHRRVSGHHLECSSQEEPRVQYERGDDTRLGQMWVPAVVWSRTWSGFMVLSEFPGLSL